jgi:peptide/nickel transport system permease protein
MVSVLAIWLRWLPVAGSESAGSWVMPALALGCGLAPGLARVIRHGVTGAMAAPYANFARMRGIVAWRVALYVVGRPALVPILAYAPVLAMQFLEGFVAIELLFNLDGIGLLLVRSLLAGDIPVVMAASMLVAVSLAGVTTATDVALRLVDPRLQTTQPVA